MLGTPEAVVGGMEGGSGPTGIPPTTAATERAGGSGPRASSGDGRQRPDPAVPKQRRTSCPGAENRALIEEGDDRLKRTKYLWTTSKENVPPQRRAELRELRDAELKTARAWAIKENLRHLWSYRIEGWARRFFDGWRPWAMRSRLEPVKAVARTQAGRLGNVITYGAGHRAVPVVCTDRPRAECGPCIRRRIVAAGASLALPDPAAVTRRHCLLAAHFLPPLRWPRWWGIQHLMLLHRLSACPLLS